MATWSSLLAEVLTLTESTGASDIEEMAKIYLVRALKYISRKANLNNLVSSANYTWLSTDLVIPVGIGGFGITDFEVPYFILVGNDSSTSTRIPYNYLDIKDWLVLKGSTNDGRIGLDSLTTDQRFYRSFTINYDNEVELDPVPQDELVTLHYYKAPAPFGDGSGSPEMPGVWQDLLVDVAVLLTRSVISGSEGELTNTFELYKSVDEMIINFKQQLEGNGYRRNRIRIHSNYNTRQFRRMRA